MSRNPEPSGGGIFVLGIVIGALAVATPSCIHVATSDTEWEKQAVKAGVAEYYLDSNADRQFRFLPGNVKKEAP